jgi:hypothetical protein
MKIMRDILYDVVGLTFLNLRATRCAPQRMENMNRILKSILKKIKKSIHSLRKIRSVHESYSWMIIYWLVS